MRRHAKASTAGPTQRQANCLGRFFRGALATHASAPRVPGSGAPSARRLAPAWSLLGFICLAALALIVVIGNPASSAAAEECPNEIRRQEQGTLALGLPECRAYENATPGSRIRATSGGDSNDIQVSVDGNAIGYESVYPAAGEENSGIYYLSRRGPNGWAAHNVIPQEGGSTADSFGCRPTVFFSSDFTRNILEEDFNIYETNSNAGVAEGFCESNEAILDPREVKGFRNLFLHEVAGGIYGGYQLASLNLAEGPPGNSYFSTASDGFGTIAFESEAQLTPQAPGVTPDAKGGWNMFVWSKGVVRLATILPDGTPVQARLTPQVGGVSPELSHSLADDGSKLFFTYEGAIYMRVNPTQPQSVLSGGQCIESEMACTYWVDESQGPDASNGSFFEYATPDGAAVFFTSDSRLTPDSTAVSGNEDLYEYDTETHDLTDLTVNASEPADVWAISDISEDGSYVYFVAEAALEGSGVPAAGNCEHYEEDNACPLYMYHNGVTTYIASLSVDDTGDFKGERYLGQAGHYDGHLVAHHESNNIPTVESSSSGRYLAFNSVQDILGEGDGVYLYDAVTDQLSCVDCGEGEVGYGSPPSVGIQPETSLDAGATVFKRNQVLDSGVVFLDTETALVPADTNEEQDAYEYKNGQLYLISTGIAQGRTNFIDATLSGSDVYFATPADILPTDVDGGGMTVYDARIDGGFPEPPPLPGCEGEACRGAGTGASNAGATGSASFQGAGNQAQGHKRDCGIAAKRAQKFARAAKSLRRRANGTNDAELAKQLRKRSAQLAKQGRSLSKSAKRCRRANRGAGK